jgi:hypothetical protein
MKANLKNILAMAGLYLTLFSNTVTRKETYCDNTI